LRGKGKVLFFGEPVTLAHVVRPVLLARALAAAGHQVALATGEAYARFAAEGGVPVRRLWSIGTARFLDAVAASRPVFTTADLDRAVADDLAHIDAFGPDLVVGDFRLSLATSARVARVPYVAISNAYWSPYAQPAWEIPVHPLSRLLGPEVASALFRAVRPLAFAQHALPSHRVRRRHGLASLGFDLRDLFTEGDVTVFADAPEIVPSPLPHDVRRFRYIGPLHWSPDAPLPASLAAADARPLAYVTLGSSGDPALVARVLDALAPLGCRVAVATAGRLDPRSLPADVIAAEYLPGEAVARRAALVVSNGGSLTAQQALSNGVALLGIPANLDQLLNMGYMRATGAALSVRPESATVDRLRDACRRLLQEPQYRAAARRVQEIHARYDAPAAFTRVVAEILGASAPPAGTAAGIAPRNGEAGHG
jgi:UDP:flavonoid glycosyltransferase YjiC (YdhE family)